MNPMPSRAPVHTTDSMTTRAGPSSRITASGVYDPAMNKKMFEWSNRLRIRHTFGDQVPRW
ncbi:hypothetical protein FQZ97_1141100 [compost metagenome]